MSDRAPHRTVDTETLRAAWERVRGRKLDDCARQDIELLVGAAPGLLDVPDGALRAAWVSYHALALATKHCDPRHLDTRCLGCGELERLARERP